MVPSYNDTEWQVGVRQDSESSVIQIRVLENGAWKDYWVPQDPGNSDYAQYLEWVAAGNQPKILFGT